MPESKIRKKAAYTPPPGKAAPVKPNPRWFLPVVLGLMIVGLAWVVTYYLSQGKYPIPDFDAKNLLVGFALMMAGFIGLTRWR
ncbi:MAG: cell division protein CrgA [Kineosporiaceae bacterium]